MAWIYLVLAALCEMCWPFGFNLSSGFTNWGKNWPIILATFGIMLASFALMSLASRELAVGTVYAVWTGLGTTGIVIIGMIYFKEPRDLSRFICLALIIIGVVGLKLNASADDNPTPRRSSTTPPSATTPESST